MPKAITDKILNLCGYFLAWQRFPCILQKKHWERLKIARRFNAVLLAAAIERDLVATEKELLFVLTNEKTLFDTAPNERNYHDQEPDPVNSRAGHIRDWVSRAAVSDKAGVAI